MRDDDKVNFRSIFFFFNKVFNPSKSKKNQHFFFFFFPRKDQFLFWELVKHGIGDHLGIV